MLRLTTACAFVLGIGFPAWGAIAAPACSSYDVMSDQLDKRFAEAPVAGGLAQNGKLLQVFSSKNGSSWTVVLTQPDGTSCIVAAGRHWRTVQVKDPQA